MTTRSKRICALFLLTLFAGAVQSVGAANLFSDDFESDANGDTASFGGYRKDFASISYLVSTGTEFGSSSKYMTITDTNELSFAGLATPAQSGANGTLTTLSLDFYEPASGGDDAMSVGYDDNIGTTPLGSLNRRAFITLDNGAIGGTDGSGTTTYTIDTPYTVLIVFNDTASPTNYINGDIAAQDYDVFIHPVGFPENTTFVGTGTAGNSQTDYTVGFRTFNAALQTLCVDNFSLDTGAPDNLVLASDMAVLYDGDEIAVGATNAFTATFVNTPVSRTYVVTNLASSSGNLLLTNSTAAVVFDESGTTNYNGFTITENITGGSTNIAPGGSASFTISFVTNTVGSYTGTVNIANNDPDEDPYTFVVTATVTAPAPDMQVLFGGSEIAVGATNALPATTTDTAVTRAYTVTNLTAASANLYLTNSPNAIVFDNGLTSQNGFTISANITGGSTNLAAGACASFSIQFVTNALGTYTGAVSIANNDSDKDPYTFKVTAQVVSVVSSPATYTSDGAFVVPPGVTEITIKAWGAGGGGGGGGKAGNGAAGGGGAFVQGTYAVTPGDALNITVGGGGGGGFAVSAQGPTGHGGGGGGRSSVSNSTASALLLVAAGGGGGGGGDNGTLHGGAGGAGGSASGANGAAGDGGTDGGEGGTQNDGGGGGASNAAGVAGSAFTGGAGGFPNGAGSSNNGGSGGGGSGGGISSTGWNPGAGGGGAGLFGGGGGSGADGANLAGGGGGGGSSYTNSAGTDTQRTAGSGTDPANSGDVVYEVGVGVGGAGGAADATTGTPGTAGGDGLVVVTYISPDMQVLYDGSEIAVDATNAWPSTSPNTAIIRTYTVTNLASATTNLYLTNSPAVVFSESGTTNYNGFTIITNITGAATNLAAGESEQFTISFAASAYGTYAATVRIANNDPIKNPYTFSVTADVISMASHSSVDYILGRKEDGHAPELGYYEINNDMTGVGGSGGARYCRNVVLGYTLPSLPVGKVVSGATLTFTIKSARDDNSDDPALNVYIFTNAAPATTGTNLYYHGPSNSTASAKFVGSTYVDAGTTDTNVNEQVSYSLSGEALNVLKRFYNADHIPDVAEAFFRFNLDQVMPAISVGDPYQRYFIDVTEGASSLTIIHSDPPPTTFRFR